MPAVHGPDTAPCSQRPAAGGRAWARTGAAAHLGCCRSAKVALRPAPASQAVPPPDNAQQEEGPPDLGCLDHQFFRSEADRLLRRARSTQMAIVRNCESAFNCGRQGSAAAGDASDTLQQVIIELGTYWCARGLARLLRRSRDAWLRLESRAARWRGAAGTASAPLTRLQRCTSCNPLMSWSRQLLRGTGKPARRGWSGRRRLVLARRTQQLAPTRGMRIQVCARRGWSGGRGRRFEQLPMCSLLRQPAQQLVA